MGNKRSVVSIEWKHLRISFTGTKVRTTDYMSPLLGNVRSDYEYEIEYEYDFYSFMYVFIYLFIYLPHRSVTQ